MKGKFKENQLKILECLNDDSLKIAENISDEIKLSHTNTRNLLYALKRKKLIEVIHFRFDRRRHMYKITKLGKAFLKGRSSKLNKIF